MSSCSPTRSARWMTRLTARRQPAGSFLALPAGAVPEAAAFGGRDGMRLGRGLAVAVGEFHGPVGEELFEFALVEGCVAAAAGVVVEDGGGHLLPVEGAASVLVDPLAHDDALSVEPPSLGCVGARGRSVRRGAVGSGAWPVGPGSGAGRTAPRFGEPPRVGGGVAPRAAPACRAAAGRRAASGPRSAHRRTARGSRRVGGRRRARRGRCRR